MVNIMKYTQPIPFLCIWNKCLKSNYTRLCFSRVIVERQQWVSARHLWMNNESLALFTHLQCIASRWINFQCSHFLDLYQSYTRGLRFIYSSFFSEQATNVLYGPQTAIKHHILNKINKQVYQAGSKSRFKEMPDLFLPQGTCLPRMNKHRQFCKSLLSSLQQKHSEREGKTHFFKQILHSISTACLRTSLGWHDGVKSLHSICSNVCQEIV